jgi:transcriptional regulator with GAF, ATPase, and Fis domain/tetratricopeptide (TPR) repeat protein
VRSSIPPNDFSAAPSSLPDEVLRQEEFGDLSQAADQFGAARDYYARALELVPDSHPDARARLLVKLAECDHRQGRFSDALARLREARAATRSLADPVVTGTIASRMATASVASGRYRAGARLARAAFRILRASSEHTELGLIETTIGIAALRTGDYGVAHDAFTGALATFRRVDDLSRMAGAHNNLGLVYKNTGQWREATRAFEQALRLAEKVGDYFWVAVYSRNLGIMRYRLGELDLALECFRRSLQIETEIPERMGEIRTRLSLGRLHVRRRELDLAAAEFDAVERLFAAGDVPREHVLLLEFRGEIELEKNSFESARTLLADALERAEELAPDGDLAYEAGGRLALALLALGRLDEARRQAAKAEDRAERAGDVAELAIARRASGLVAIAAGDEEAALADLRAAQVAFEDLGDRFELARTFALAADRAVLSGALAGPVADWATDQLKRAQALFRDLGVPALAADAAILNARLLAARSHLDQALTEIEHARTWLRESGVSDAESRVAPLRSELEARSAASSVSTSNEFRALQEANDIFKHADDVHAVLGRTVRLAVERAGGDRGFVAFASGGGRLEVVAHHNLGADRAKKVLASLERVVGRELVQGAPVFKSRIAADPAFAGELSGALQGVFSLVVVPLTFPSQAVGLVYVDRLTDNLRGAFRQREINLLAVLANSAAVAMVEAQRSVLLEENQVLKQRLQPTPGLERVITRSSEMQEILALLAKVGDSTASILLMGETGTGKGLLARAIHEMSVRRDGRFVAVNCAALPDTLLESELFGYVAGAFTGAVRDKEGLFKEADGGTIFLDEVEKISEPLQAKLLHVLDHGEIRPVGSTRSAQVDARVIAATNADLRDRIKAGRFLEDLYYRMNDIAVTVPPLRERREDIAALTDHFLAHYARQMDKPIPQLLPAVRTALLNHEWRGNVRELEKAIKRLVVLAEPDQAVGVELLPEEMRLPVEESVESLNGSFNVRQHVERLERRLIREALEHHAWNKTQAARTLGLSYPTLLSKIRLLGLDRRRLRV